MDMAVDDASLEGASLAKALLHILITVDSEAEGVPEVLFSDTAANEAALDGSPRAPPGELDVRPLFVDRSAFGAALRSLTEASLCAQQGASLRLVEGAQSVAGERLVSPRVEAAIVAALVRVLQGRFVHEASWGAPGLKRLAPLAPVAEAVLKQPSLTWLERAGLCESLGVYLTECAGRLQLGAFYLKQALGLKAEQLGADHEETCHAANELGVCYKAMAMYDEAEPLLLRAADGLLRHGSTEGQLRAEHNLGALHTQRGQYVQADGRIRSALQAAQRALPADHSLVGALQLALANLLSIQVRARTPRPPSCTRPPYAPARARGRRRARRA